MGERENEERDRERQEKKKKRRKSERGETERERESRREKRKKVWCDCAENGPHLLLTEVRRCGGSVGRKAEQGRNAHG